MKKDSLIFVVDDDEFILTTIAHYLRRQGFTNVQTFTNKHDCLVYLMQRPPQLCIIDYILGNDNGWIFCKEILEIIPNAIVVLLSGQDDVMLTFQFIREGLRHYVTKDETMLDTLEEILMQLNHYNTQLN